MKKISPSPEAAAREVNEVPVVNAAECPELLLEAVKRVRIEARQGLERHQLPALPVEHFVHDPHAAPAEAAQYFVAAAALPVLGRVRVVGARRWRHAHIESPT